MEQKILVPDLGDYKQVEIIEVLLKVGDKVDKDATMLTLETDKATMELPAPVNFTVVDLHVKVGDRVSKGDLVATAIVAQAAEPSANSNQLPEAQPSSRSSSIELPSAPSSQNITSHSTTSDLGLSGFGHASPGVRKFARELGVDLAQVVGTNQHGRIGQDDVKRYVQDLLLNSSGMGGASISQANLTKEPAVDFSKWGEISSTELPRIKKRSGQQLHKNWLNIPHVTHFDTADLTALEKFRKTKQQNLPDPQLKLTPLGFLLKIVVKVLQQEPLFNSSLAPNLEQVILKKYYNIGVAVATPAGLVVPVIKQVDQKDLITLATELAAVSAKARANKLTAEDLQGGTFTISSLGGIGGHGFTPIINAPEVAILGVSRHKLIPEYDAAGKLQAKLILPFALSYDHRVIDGAEAAKFCRKIAEYIESEDFSLFN